jgi:hypothetical protein
LGGNAHVRGQKVVAVAGVRAAGATFNGRGSAAGGLAARDALVKLKSAAQRVGLAVEIAL